MKFQLKKLQVTEAVALVLCSTLAATSAQAAAVNITNGTDTSMSVDDAGYISGLSALGLSFSGTEYINHGEWHSFYQLNANGSVVGGVSAAEVEGGGTNPLGASAFGPIAGGTTAVSTNLGSSNTTGWTFSETVSVVGSGHITFSVSLTNNTGRDASDVQWGFGLDPDQGIPGTGLFDTHNTINGIGNASSITAISSDGYSLTLANTTTSGAFAISPYIDGVCCSPVDPNVMLTAGQTAGYYGFFDHSINLGYDIGAMAAGQTVTLGYDLVMTAVPEPETYAMLLAGLGLVGFSVRRRKIA